MTLIKNILKTVLISTLLSANAYSSDLLVDTTIDDTADDASWSRKNSDSNFNIEQMDVSSIGTEITVDIYTNFVEYNDDEIYFGDLLISTGAEGSAYDYAFVLGDARDDDYARERTWYNDTKTSVMDGTLVDVTDTTASTCTTTETTGHCHSSTTTTTTTVDDDVIVMASGDEVGDGTWEVTNYDEHYYNSSYTDIISFSFNVGHLDDFLDASQLAFSWTMSCANDVVEGFAVVNQRTSVPEPATILLMLCALAFMANSRKKLND